MAHLAVQVGDLLHGAPVVAGAVFGLAARNRDRACCAAWSFSAAQRPWRGLGTKTPFESARKFAMPRSIPTTLPVAGNGPSWSCSTLSTTNHLRPSRLT